MKKGGAPFGGRNMAAQIRQRNSREPESKRVDKLREATAQVVVMCALSALNNRFGLGEARLRRVVDQVSIFTDVFEQKKQTAGWRFARLAIRETTRDYWPGFLLPAVIPPKTSREKMDLGEQREVAETVLQIYAAALHEVMSFGAERIKAFTEATEREYREFADRAKDGDYFGYELLAQKLGKIVHDEVTVDDSEAIAPVFGKTLD